MSVIVAVKENGVVYLGADTQTTAGAIKQKCLSESSFKIVKLKNGILLGICGKVSARQIILSDSDLFTLDENGQLTKAQIVREIIPKLIDKMEQIGDKESGDLDVSLLLAYKDKMYRISSGLNVVSLSEVARQGSGSDKVCYVLHGLKDLPVRERILKALVQSAKHTDSVGGPFVLIDTERLEYEIVDKGEENH